MKNFRRTSLIAVSFFCFVFCICYPFQILKGQVNPFTFPEILKYLYLQVPNERFKSKDEVINFLIDEISKRKVDKPITPDIEALFREVGANDALLTAIAKNYQTSPSQIVIQTPLKMIDIGVELRKLKPTDSKKELISLIESRKVQGVLDQTGEEFLRLDGATDDVIKAIRENPFVSNVTPTATPIQTPTPTPTPSPEPTATPIPKLPPFKLTEIGAELRKLKPTDSQSALILLIEQRKVEGTLDKTAKEFLLLDGAKDDLIVAIQKNLLSAASSVKPVTPTPTPTPTTIQISNP